MPFRTNPAVERRRIQLLLHPDSSNGSCGLDFQSSTPDSRQLGQRKEIDLPVPTDMAVPGDSLTDLVIRSSRWASLGFLGKASMIGDVARQPLDSPCAASGGICEDDARQRERCHWPAIQIYDNEVELMNGMTQWLEDSLLSTLVAPGFCFSLVAKLSEDLWRLARPSIDDLSHWPRPSTVHALCEATPWTSGRRSDFVSSLSFFDHLSYPSSRVT
jgi:hypothetical protein